MPYVEVAESIREFHHQPARRDKLLLVCRFAGIDVSRRMCHSCTAVRALTLFVR